MAEGGRKNAPNLAKQFSLVIRSTIHYPAACRCVPDRAPVPRAYARERSERCTARRHAIRHGRGARRRHAILEHASPVLGSGLGKIGQAGDPGIVTRTKPNPPGRDPGAPGAGREALISPKGAGAGRWSALENAVKLRMQSCGRKFPKSCTLL